MVSIGDGAIIGHDATITCHLYENASNGNDPYGIFAKVVIGKSAVIGTEAHINPGCVVGDGAVVGGKAYVPKNTNIPAGEIWAGIQAKCIRSKRRIEV